MAAKLAAQEIQQGKVLGTALGSHQPCALLQAWAIVRKLPGGKRPGYAGWQMLLIRFVLQTLPQLPCLSLDMLHHLQVFPEMPRVLVLTPYLASQNAIVNCLVLFPPFSWMFLIGQHLEFNEELFFPILPDTNYKALYCISTVVIMPLSQGKKRAVSNQWENVSKCLQNFILILAFLLQSFT